MKRRLAVWTAVVAISVVLAACGSDGKTSTEGTPGSPVPSSSPATTATSSTSSPSTSSPGGTDATSSSAASSSLSTTAPATMTVSVWFLDRAHAQTGEEPLYRPVDREVSAAAPAAGALDALFAGPTPAEQADGLELLLSGATGYSNLHIDDGIAYVQLDGGCASLGSTMTIAGEIEPTLKQFGSVDYVKIFGPDGTTEAPTGAVDSIPYCLEP